VNTLAVLDWLCEHRFLSLTRRAYDWLFAFDGDVSLRVACLWRLIEAGHIRFTSQDDGQQFGLPAPVNAASEINSRLASASIKSVELEPALLDFEIRFSSGHVLQIIPDSSGDEAWELWDGKSSFIAGGGGDLTEFTGGGGD
jgi:hypothetical protein